MTSIKSVLASISILAVLLVGGATLALAQESEAPATEQPSESTEDSGEDSSSDDATRRREDCPEKSDNSGSGDATESSL